MILRGLICLHMKILFSARAHARIRNLDVSQAESLPGLIAVLTARDVPTNEYGLQKKDQPVLCGPAGKYSPGKVAVDVVRFEGDQVAAVIAINDTIAAEALKLISVDYEDLPGVFDPEVAMSPDAPILHPELGTSNICVQYKIRKGNTIAALATADVIVEDEYFTPWQEHAYLQPEAGLAYIDEAGRITVESAGQWTNADREGIAHALDIPEDLVRIIYPAIGGAFGGREDLSVQIVLALGVMKLKRPIKIVWDRRESIIGHGKRHPMKIKAKWGASREVN